MHPNAPVHSRTAVSCSVPLCVELLCWVNGACLQECRWRQERRVLHSLPRCVGDALFAVWCCLQDLDVGASCLRWLDVEVLLGAAASLTRLDLADTSLAEVPEGIAGLTGLQVRWGHGCGTVYDACRLTHAVAGVLPLNQTSTSQPCLVGREQEAPLCQAPLM
jgi:hypothetical protein